MGRAPVNNKGLEVKDSKAYRSPADARLIKTK
jgi:hypothetical protein